MIKTNKFSRRGFLSRGIGLGMSCCAMPGLAFMITPDRNNNTNHFLNLYSKTKGTKYLFADDEMIALMKNVSRRIHPAMKLEYPVLEADMQWEQGEIYDGKRDRRVYIYGTVFRNENTGSFSMWYNRIRSAYYATSYDGINWQRPELGIIGRNNMINLFDFHSPSFIFDEREPDSKKRYKVVGSTKEGYCAAYSADGLNWTLYPKNPILKSSDTITLAQDPANGEYLAFHKVNNDPRVKGRQVFLSVSKDMQNWTNPVPVMVTDEIDHMEAQKLEGGTHSEFYNMSAFPYGDQWLGFVTHFRRTGEPRIKKFDGGSRQSFAEGPIDIQLVHSRDGRTWNRCSDRSPVIPLGPYAYDSGSILGLCNSPVIVGDEIWMYYTAMTTSHGCALPEKEMSIARASWRLDGLVSMQAQTDPGIIETVPFTPDGDRLYLNIDVKQGELMVEILDNNGNVITGYDKNACLIQYKDSVNLPIKWNNLALLPKQKSIRLRFYMKRGDLYSYSVI